MCVFHVLSLCAAFFVILSVIDTSHHVRVIVVQERDLAKQFVCLLALDLKQEHLGVAHVPCFRLSGVHVFELHEWMTVVLVYGDSDARFHVCYPVSRTPPRNVRRSFVPCRGTRQRVRQLPPVPSIPISAAQERCRRDARTRWRGRSRRCPATCG